MTVNQNSGDQSFTNNSDGYALGGGTTARKLTVTGADITLTGSGTSVYTFPSGTDTVVTLTATQTLTNKTLTSPTLTTPALGTPASGTLTNCTFPTLNQNTTGSAATLTTTRTLWGQNFNGSANVTGDITLGASSITMTGSIATTGSRVTKGWFTDIESTNAPTIGGTAATGSGGLVRATSPTLVTPLLGTPTSGVATNLTGLPLTTGVTGVLPIANGGTNSSTGAVVTVKTQVFTGSGTYTPSTGMLYCFVRCVGGGGGGAGVKATNGYGAGGGAGSYAEKMLSAATVGSSQTVTIGAAGAGGDNTGGTGGNGGDTSLGTLCVGKGGTGATGVTTAVNGAAGAGGVAGTGDVTIVGQPGGRANGSYGGDCIFGSSGGGTIARGAAAANAVAGTGYGAGGDGAFDSNSTGYSGAAGMPGLMIITEWCSQ